MCKNTSTRRVQAWRERNPGVQTEYMRNYRGTSLDEFLLDANEIWFTKDARKRKLLKQATPIWVDREAIRSVYHMCVAANQKYPDLNFVVHHIIPITHSKVSGLHVVDNLKVVSSRVKAKLGRKFYDQSA